MNEPAMAPQEYPPKMAEQIDDILQAFGSEHEDVKLLKSYVHLLRRQARNGSNRKRALADLHRAHQALVMENRWLREAIRVDSIRVERNHIGQPIMERARNTLWSQFRRLRSGKATKEDTR